MAAHITTDIATRIGIGPRDRRQARVRTDANEDASRVIAAVDGSGEHLFGDETAKAAANAAHYPIGSSEEL